MELSEVQSYFESNKDNTQVQEYLKGLSKPTLDSVKGLVGTDKDFKAWFDSEKDSHHNKALEKFKSKELSALVDAEVKKRFPDADPKDVKMKELELKLQEIQSAKERETLVNSALKVINEKKLPVKAVDMLIGKDQSATDENIKKFEELLNEYVEAILKEKGKDGYIPPSNNNNNNFNAKTDPFSIIQKAKHRK